MKITITNTFHLSSVNVIVPSFPVTLSQSQINRVEKALCNVPGCKCGTMWSERHTEISGIEDGHFEPCIDESTGDYNGAELVEN